MSIVPLHVAASNGHLSKTHWINLLKQNIKRRNHICAQFVITAVQQMLICDSICTSKTGLKIHIDAVHEGKTPHKCWTCDYSVASMSTLKSHINTVHEEKSHIYAQLAITVVDQSILWENNEKMKLHKCLICD